MERELTEERANLDELTEVHLGAGALLAIKDAHIDREELPSRIDDAIRRADRARSLVQSSSRNINKLWSDCSGNDTYKNNHSCWDYFKAVN